MSEDLTKSIENASHTKGKTVEMTKYSEKLNPPKNFHRLGEVRSLYPQNNIQLNRNVRNKYTCKICIGKFIDCPQKRVLDKMLLFLAHSIPLSTNKGLSYNYKHVKEYTGTR